MSYFIYRNEKREGAFSMDELQKLKLFPDDLVWVDNDWKRSDTIDELRNHLIVRPPLTPTELKKKKIKSLIQETIFKALALYITVSLILAFLISITAIEGYKNRSAGSDKYPIYLTAAEQQNHSLVYTHNILSTFLWMLPIALVTYFFFIYYFFDKKTTLKVISPETIENKNESLTSAANNSNEDVSHEFKITVVVVIIVFIVLLYLLISNYQTPHI